MTKSKWLFEAVVQRGTNDLYGDAPSDMGTDNEDSILANDEYGTDEDEKNLVKEAEPVRSSKDIRTLQKLGYSDERIGRIDRSESDVIIMNRIQAKKSGKGRKTKYLPDRRRPESIKEKAQAFWTELDENLFTKASTSGRTFLPREEDDEDIDEHHEDQYNTTVDEKSPKGWEGTVKSMKKHKDIDNPWALTHWMKNKGYKSHKTKSGKDK